MVSASLASQSHFFRREERAEKNTHFSPLAPPAEKNTAGSTPNGRGKGRGIPAPHLHYRQPNRPLVR